jgi:hypothetical protein
MLQDTGPQPLASLPLWMQYFSFGVSAILAAIKIWDWSRMGQLDVRLTREAKFRIADSGETIVCNAVLLARNRPVLVRNMAAVLLKKDVPNKSFPLEILQFGERTKGVNSNPEDYFYSVSPLAFVPHSVPQRGVYVCVQAAYKDSIHAAVRSFETSLLELKDRYSEEQKEHPTLAEVVHHVRALIDECAGRMMESLQIEPGKYELTVSLKYGDPSSRVRKSDREAASRISFDITPDVRDSIRAGLKQTLFVMADNIVNATGRTVTFPEYVPTRIEELGP